MIQIYHAKHPTFDVPAHFTRGSVERFVRDFHHVANVETDDLDRAYYLTNTVNKPWWENGEVKFLGSPDHGLKGCRSSSIGDVFVRPEGDTYVAYVVDKFGFKKLKD